MHEALWRNRFGADPAIAGCTIPLDFAPYRVTGVVYRALDFPPGMDIYRAAHLGSAQNCEVRSLFAVARLRRDVFVEQAAQFLQAFAARMEATFPSTMLRIRVTRVLLLQLRYCPLRGSLCL